MTETTFIIFNTNRGHKVMLRLDQITMVIDLGHECRIKCGPTEFSLTDDFATIQQKIEEAINATNG